MIKVIQVGKKYRKNQFLFTENGFGLVQVVIASSIMVVLSLGMATMFMSQQSQVKILSQKQEIIDLKNTLLRQISNSSVCSWQLANKTFSINPIPTLTAPSATVIALANNTIYTGTDNASPPIARKDNAIVGTSTNLVVESVSFQEIYQVNAASNEYLGSFVISFKQSTGSILQAPAKVQQTIVAPPDATPGLARITSCKGSADSATTGEIRPFIGIAPRSGWVLASGGTVGGASSAATLRANDDTKALFELLWNSLNNGLAPVSGGRGGSSAADWSANKSIAVPDLRGRALFGKDDMGGAAIGRITFGVSQLDGTVLGNTGGDQRLHAHTHPIAPSALGFNASCGCGGGGSSMWWNGGMSAAATQPNLEGGGSQNIPPAIIVMYQIKL